MYQSEGVSKLVYGFFFTPLVEQPFVRGEAVELLPKPVNRHHRSAILKLSFSKDKSEHRDKQINAADPKKLCAISVMIQQLGENLRRVVLTTGSIEGVSRIKRFGADKALSAHYLPECG